MKRALETKHRWVGREAELNRHLREASDAGHGVLTLDDFRNLGVTETMVKSRKRSGQFIPVLRGVVTLPGTKLTEKGRARAATYACGSRCCLSHRSALSLHGLVRERGPVQVVRESGGGHGKGSPLIHSERFDFAVERHQVRRLEASQITEVEGIPTLTVERALLGFAAKATDAEIGKALSQGERERVLCWATLNELVTRTNGVKGLRRLKREIAEWTSAYAETASEPEEDLLRLIVGAGLPVPSVNQFIGHVKPDFLWTDLHLAVELDPYGTHKGYESFHRDRRKSIFLEGLGMRVIRFTWDDLYNHPERTLAELRKIMIQQARLHGVTNLGSI